MNKEYVNKLLKNLWINWIWFKWKYLVIIIFQTKDISTSIWFSSTSIWWLVLDNKGIANFDIGSITSIVLTCSLSEGAVSYRQWG